MYGYICLFFILNFIYSSFKVGIDFNSEVEMSSNSYYYGQQSVDYDLDNGFSFGFQTHRGNGVSFGIDYLMETEIEDGTGMIEASLITVYALYPFYTSSVENNPQMVVSGMLGYSVPDVSISGIDAGEIETEGGLMYGIEALLNNHYSAAITFHSGEFGLAGYSDTNNLGFDLTRFTLSYIF